MAIITVGANEAVRAAYLPWWFIHVLPLLTKPTLNLLRPFNSGKFLLSWSEWVTAPNVSVTKDSSLVYVLKVCGRVVAVV